MRPEEDKALGRPVPKKAAGKTGCVEVTLHFGIAARCGRRRGDTGKSGDGEESQEASSGALEVAPRYFPFGDLAWLVGPLLRIPVYPRWSKQADGEAETDGPGAAIGLVGRFGPW